MTEAKEQTSADSLSEEHSKKADPANKPAQDDTVDAKANNSESQEKDDLIKKIPALEAKVRENWDHYLRTKAEVENVRRRAQKDVESAHKFSIEKLVGELIPIVDSMELGLAAANDENADVAKFREGSELTLKMLIAVIEKHGVVAIDPKGEKFNPEHHQAMTMKENNEVEANTVLAVVQKGYLMHERLVRPAMVIVSKSSSPPADNKPIDERV